MTFHRFGFLLDPTDTALATGETPTLQMSEIYEKYLEMKELAQQPKEPNPFADNWFANDAQGRR